MNMTRRLEGTIDTRLGPIDVGNSFFEAISPATR